MPTLLYAMAGPAALPGDPGKVAISCSGLFFALAFHAGAMSAVPGGVVTTVVGADVWIGKSAFRVINPQIRATLNKRSGTAL